MVFFGLCILCAASYMIGVMTRELYEAWVQRGMYEEGYTDRDGFEYDYGMDWYDDENYDNY